MTPSEVLPLLYKLPDNWCLTMQCHFNGTLLINVLPPLLLTEFILGVVGNGLALWLFCFHLKPWKSSTVLLFNLAVADFLLNMVLPLRASYYSRRRRKLEKRLQSLSQL